VHASFRHVQEVAGAALDTCVAPPDRLDSSGGSLARRSQALASPAGPTWAGGG
jgi:hypothetical protein